MESIPTQAPVEGGPRGLQNHQLRALLSMVGVALLLNYVETMIIPGIPTIQSDFGTTASVVSRARACCRPRVPMSLDSRSNLRTLGG